MGLWQHKCLLCGRKALRPRGNYGCEHCREEFHPLVSGMVSIDVSVTRFDLCLFESTFRACFSHRRFGYTPDEKSRLNKW